MANCKAITTSGARCKNQAQPDSDFCHIESHQQQSGIVAPEWAEGLTDKERRFVEEYCIDYNASRAARDAGYSKKTAGVIGHETLKKPKIKAAIEAHMDELAMGAAETKKRLADMARGSHEPFLVWDEQQQTLQIDLSSPQARKSLHLIKKLKQNDTIVQKGTDNQPEVIGRTFEIEIHDPKDALKQIGKILGIYAPDQFEDVSKHPKQLVIKRAGGSDE